MRVETRIAEQTADLTDKGKTLQQTEAILGETQDSRRPSEQTHSTWQMSAGIVRTQPTIVAALQTARRQRHRPTASRGRGKVAENLQMSARDRYQAHCSPAQNLCPKKPRPHKPSLVPGAIEHAQIINRTSAQRKHQAVSSFHPRSTTACNTKIRNRSTRQVLVNLLPVIIDAMLWPKQSHAKSLVRQIARSVLKSRDHGPVCRVQYLCGNIIEPTVFTDGRELGGDLTISTIVEEGYGSTLSATTQRMVAHIFT